MVFPWRLQNGEPRPECATCLAAASTWSFKGNVDVRLDAFMAIGGSEEQPTVPNIARRADRSCEAGRQGGGAGSGAKVRKSVSDAAVPAEVNDKLPPANTQNGVIIVRIRIISIYAVMLATMVFPWRLQNGEPRPQCATCLAAASTWSFKGNVDVRLDAFMAIGGSV
jgi:hypothetical protein